MTVVQSEEYQRQFERLSGELVNATTHVYKQATACLLPTPAKSHYIFNLRDFSRVVVGICLVRKDTVDKRDVMIRYYCTPPSSLALIENPERRYSGTG